MVPQTQKHIVSYNIPAFELVKALVKDSSHQGGMQGYPEESKTLGVRAHPDTYTGTPNNKGHKHGTNLGRRGREHAEPHPVNSLTRL